ncbi:MAG: hypothetical protein RLZZ232_1658, partial [Planctomycetota bacterium]
FADDLSSASRCAFVAFMDLWVQRGGGSDVVLGEGSVVVAILFSGIGISGPL